MAIMKKSDSSCVILAGGDPFTDATFSVEDPEEGQGIDITFNGEA